MKLVIGKQTESLVNSLNPFDHPGFFRQKIIANIKLSDSNMIRVRRYRIGSSYG